MKPSLEYPDFIADTYDLIYDKILTGEDLEYYTNKIHNSTGPILELGAGTGRLFLNALEGGADIYGIDVSPEMIRVLKDKINTEDHYRLSIQNAVNLKLPVDFQLIIAPFRMFSHLIHVEDQLGCLNSVYKHLKPGGFFIMDVFVPNLKMLTEGIHNIKDFDEDIGNSMHLTRTVDMHTDLINQINHVTMTIEKENKNKKFRKSWCFEMRYFFRFELEHLIQQSKLELVNIYGNFLEEELNEKSKEFIVVCTKPN